MSEINKYLDKIASCQHLTEEESARTFQIVMSGGASPVQISALLMGLRINGETVEEITGAAKAIRAKAVKLKLPELMLEAVVDTCGTGGDGQGTFNISTATAFVVAGCGIPVAKHGNKAISSRSGSADVLSELGVNVNAEIEVVQKSLLKAGLCFMLAPKYHSAMRYVAPVRQELGIRTVFNLLGPLTNPAGATRQVIGVYDRKWVEPLAHVLKALGCIRGWVVHGSDGLDELTTTGISYVAELREGEVRSFTVDPAELGIPLVSAGELKGGTPEENAMKLRHILKGKEGPLRDIVLLNAAAALVVAGVAQELEQGMALAAGAIASGKASEVLERVVEVTNV